MRVFGFAGWSGSGKTTLVERLVPQLRAMGLTVSLIKHAHHDFDVDHTGKDSHRHRQAGCQEVLVTSAMRWALMHELRGAPELSIDAALAQLSPCDLALVEGFKSAAIPKLEVYRASVGKSMLHPRDKNILAVATDGPLETSLPVFDLDDLAPIAAFIVDHAESRKLKG
jgi:molybdopterin-guanine dinucleotide biosynthesis protein B